MRNLSDEEVQDISGAGVGTDIAMGLSITWAGTVAGFAAGSIVPGVGNAAGAAAGFFVGALAGVGFVLARSGDKETAGS